MHKEKGVCCGGEGGVPPEAGPGRGGRGAGAAAEREAPAAAAMEPGGRRGRAAEEGPRPEEEEVDPRIQVRAARLSGGGGKTLNFVI